MTVRIRRGRANEMLYTMHNRNYRGVFYDQGSKQWYAKQSTHGSPRWTSELYKTEREAALAYDSYVRANYTGRTGLYNFPQDGEKSVFCSGCATCPGYP